MGKPTIRLQLRRFREAARRIVLLLNGAMRVGTAFLGGVLRSISLLGPVLPVVRLKYLSYLFITSLFHSELSLFDLFTFLRCFSLF